jgi:hypothetical protein
LECAGFEAFGLTEAAGRRELDMRNLTVAAAGLCLLAMSANANVALAAGATEAKAPIVLAQNTAPKKDETVTQKVKRAWKNLTGYKFAVGCPVVLEFTKKNVKETGKDRDAARNKVIGANPGCSVKDM